MRDIKNNKNILIFIIILFIATGITYLNIIMIKNLKLLNTLLYSNENNTEITGQTVETINDSPEYHLALVYQENGEFTRKLSQGAIDTCYLKGSSLNVFSCGPTDQFSINDYFQLAMLTNYDGIIVDGESPDLYPLINQAYTAGVPVVTILSDLPGSSRISYVGVNNHRAGYIAGREMLKRIPSAHPRLAIISTDFTEDNYTPSAEYLKIFGFREAISSNPDAVIVTWEKTRPKMLDALQVITDILSRYPDIDGIFTTQSTATMAAANLLGNGREKRVVFIGYGDNKDIITAIKEGVIDISLTIDPYQIGVNAVKELLTYLNEKKVNLYSNIDIQFLTLEDIK
jgi:ribose transport system substrate-binding protein